MNASELNTLINSKCQTNDTTFTQAEKLVLCNIFKDEIASLIAERNQMFFAVPATDDLVADQREYPFADDMLNNLIKVEIKFASGDARQPAYALKDYSPSETESEIVSNFSNSEGDFAYIIRRRAILLLSGTIVAVTDGIRIWYVQYPADLDNLTDTTDLNVDPSTTTAGFPRQFHELLARRVSIEYKDRNGLKLSSKEREYDKDLQAQLDAIAHQDLNLEIIGELPPASDLWDNGYEL